jgi:hypothetical protein
VVIFLNDISGNSISSYLKSIHEVKCRITKNKTSEEKVESLNNQETTCSKPLEEKGDEFILNLMKKIKSRKDAIMNTIIKIEANELPINCETINDSSQINNMDVSDIRVNDPKERMNDKTNLEQNIIINKVEEKNQQRKLVIFLLKKILRQMKK